jgi:hypothetical protein
MYLRQCCITARSIQTTRMQAAPDWNRDAFTQGNFLSAGGILESRRDSPQNTRVGLVSCVRKMSRSAANIDLAF